MSLKTIALLCGATALAALAPSAAIAQSGFSISIGSGYGGGYSDYGYPAYGYGGDGYSNYGRHESEHAQLGDQHDDVHYELDDEHEQAHEQGVNPWEHAQLHGQLQNQHGYADYQLRRQHQREHQRSQWRRRYSNYGYYGN